MIGVAAVQVKSDVRREWAKDILPLQTRVIGKHLIKAPPCADLVYEHRRCYPHPANAGLPAHGSGAMGHAIKCFHMSRIAQGSMS
jgi:hypothetical protein